jgi:glycogenin glucosyltransferase
MSSEAFVTLVTNDTYALGALVLANSLRETKTNKAIVVLVTAGVTDKMRNTLSNVFDLVQNVDLINSNDSQILEAMKRPELGVTLSKIHCWRLTQYKKGVFLDADTLVLQNIDELFDREELSAVPDIGWPDCFNTGVFVFSPSEETFRALLKLAIEEGSFDGGDQGLLNAYFSDWSTKDISKHLSFIYNMSSIAVYSYPPAYKQFGKNVKVVHFLGSLKPWLYGYSVATGQVSQPQGAQGSQQLEHVQLWWNTFMSKVQPLLSPENSGLAGSLSKLDLSSGHYKGIDENSGMRNEFARQHAWERGQIDYLGSDAFVNIQKKIDEAINGKSSQ